MKVTQEGDTTHIQYGRRDFFKLWLHHVFGYCDAMCSYCYHEACQYKEKNNDRV